MQTNRVACTKRQVLGNRQFAVSAHHRSYVRTSSFVLRLEIRALPVAS
jgi:hypothetical protein